MVKLIGKDIWRDGEKIGWIESPHIYSHDGKKLGWFEENYIYGEDGRKLAYVEGNELFPYGGGTKTSLEAVSEAIEGGVLPEIGKCAIYVLLGD